VAVKIYSKKKLLGLRKNLKREVKLLRSINHENIIKLYAYFAHGKYVYLIMEYGGEISLCQYLKYTRYRKTSEKEI
jgi:serine/threonine protein kinase